ncbi:MAG: hypothetical protein QG577_2387, partial [Thermodesulfobacteriota bacterium]|nr:hypothetical protein [Thermodesulfobacteriota bacterium]
MKPPNREAGRNAAPAHLPARFSLPMIGEKTGQGHLKPARSLSNEWGEAQYAPEILSVWTDQGMYLPASR